MDLEVVKIKVYKQERKVKVTFDFGQFVEFVPWGEIYITTVSEGILKKDVRFMGDILLKTDYFQRHKDRNDPVLYETREAEAQISHFIGRKIKSILN